MPEFATLASEWLETRRRIESQVFAEMAPPNQRLLRALTLNEAVILMRFPTDGCREAEFVSGPGGAAPAPASVKTSMIRRSLVAREPKGRASATTQLILTPRGKRAHDLLGAFQQRVLEVMFGSLTPEQRSALDGVAALLAGASSQGPTAAE